MTQVFKTSKPFEWKELHNKTLLINVTEDDGMLLVYGKDELGIVYLLAEQDGMHVWTTDIDSSATEKKEKTEEEIKAIWNSINT